MSGTLRRPYWAIPRQPGGYVAGEYVQASEGAPVGIIAGIQPASAFDYQLMQSNIEGRRINGMFRIYCNTRLNVAGDGDLPGDIVLDDSGRRLLIIGVAERQVLRTETSHYKYYAVREIEHVTGETTL